MYKINIESSTFRNNIKTKLFNFIPDDNKCKNVEIGIYNYSIQEADKKKIVKKWDNSFFLEIYISKFRMILNNLTPELIHKIMSNEIDEPHKIAFMTHQELQPEKWSKLLDMKRKIDESIFNPTIAATTDMFKCGKCKSNHCSYYQLQTRSADEPMTTFVNCINCGNNWKC